MIISLCNGVEKIVRKEENAGYQGLFGKGLTKQAQYSPTFLKFYEEESHQFEIITTSDPLPV